MSTNLGAIQISTLASFLLRYTFRAVRSVFSDEKKLSIAALFQTFPDLLMEQVTPLSTIKALNCSLLYWLPIA